MRFHKGLNQEFTKRRTLFFASICLTIAASIATLTQCYELSSALDSVIFKNMANLEILLALFISALVFRHLAEFLKTKIAINIAMQHSQMLREKIASQVFALRSHFPSSIHSAELSALSLEGVDSTEPYLRTFYPAFLTSIITPLIIVIAVLYADLLSGVILLLTGPLIPVFAILVGSHAAQKSEKQWFELGDMARRFSDLLRGWSTLQLNNATSNAHMALEASGERYKQSTFSVLRVAFLSSFSLEFISTISTAVIAVEIGLRLLYGKIDYPAAIFILIAAPEFFNPLRNLGSAFHSSVGGIDAIKRIDAFLAITPPQSLSNKEQTLNQKSLLAFPDDWKEISIHNISVKYPDSQHFVLENFSASIKRGEIIGITGPSGIGKSTLISTLLRNLEPSSGCVSIDSVPSAEISLDSWKSQFALLPQRPTIANATIRENILLGREFCTEAEIANACELAQLTPVIKNLSNGLNSQLGENGTTLSNGQAHRVALARAFLLSAPIIVFDEPTAHLDVETEMAIASSLKLFAKSRTVIVISHRKETLEWCQRVVALSDHEQLATQ